MGLSREDVANAYSLISPKVKVTPDLLASAVISSAASKTRMPAPGGDFAGGLELDLFFKCENLQETGSFKFRGATHSVIRMKDEDLKRGVVAGSSGRLSPPNHFTSF